MGLNTRRGFGLGFDGREIIDSQGNITGNSLSAASLSASEFTLEGNKEVVLTTHNGKIFYNVDEQGNLIEKEIGLADRAPKVYYVSLSGNDNYNGTTIADSFATLTKALSVAQSNDTVFVKSGVYYIDNPIKIKKEVSLMGDNLRNTYIYANNPSDDLFYVESGVYVNGFTFRGFKDNAAAISFDPNVAPENNVIVNSPYIQNCSCITISGGTGMRVDGNHASGLRSMVSDSYTQINNGGIGVQLINRGYAQLVSIFTIYCDIGIQALSGGQCSITNSNCSFGNYGLVAEGVSNQLGLSGELSGNPGIFDDIIRVKYLEEPPKYQNALKFTQSLSADNTYYTVLSTNLIDENEFTYDIVLDRNLEIPQQDSNVVTFFQRSLIVASSITFEYVGAGTDTLKALPQNGGFPIQQNEVVQDRETYAGQVYFTSTDQIGDFRIGEDLAIIREPGIIEGETFERSLFTILTPYILALESSSD